MDNCLCAPGRRYCEKLGERNGAHILVAKACGDNAPTWGATMTTVILSKKAVAFR